MNDLLEEQDFGSEADKINAAIRAAGSDFRAFFASPGYKAYWAYMEAKAEQHKTAALQRGRTLEQREESRALYLAFLEVANLQQHLREFVFEK